MRTATLAHSADPLPSGGDFIPTDHVGVLLQEARLRAGLDLRLVAEDLRIRYHHLLALEKGRFGDLPGPTYVTGFIRAYAEYLGLDAEEIVRRHKSESGADAAGSRRLEFPVPARDGSVSAGLFLIVALVLVGAGFGGWFWMSSRDLTLAQTLAGLQTRVVAVFTEPSGADPAASDPGGSDPDRDPQADAPAAPAQVAAADGQDQPAAPDDAAANQPETENDPDGDGQANPAAATVDTAAEDASTDPLEAALDGGADGPAPEPSDPSNAAQPQTAADDPPQDEDETGAQGTDTAADPGQDPSPEQMTAASEETNEDGPVIPVPPEPPTEITETETELGQEAATDPPSQNEGAAPDVPGLASAEEPTGDDAQPGATEDASAASVQVADAETEAETQATDTAEALPPVPDTPDGDGTVDANAADTGSQEVGAETNGEPAADASPDPDAESPDPGEAPAGDATADEPASDQPGDDQPAGDATAQGEGEQPASDEPAPEEGAEVEEEPADPAETEEQPEQPDQQEAEAEEEAEEETPPAYVGRPAPASVREAGGGARIVLRANRDAWIQVRRGGDLVVRRLLRRGDTYAVPRGAGYTLNTTNAGGLEVYVDGRRRPNLGPIGASRNGIRLTPGALN